MIDEKEALGAGRQLVINPAADKEGHNHDFTLYKFAIVRTRGTAYAEFLIEGGQPGSVRSKATYSFHNAEPLTDPLAFFGY